jgi:hypothetical protein
MKVVAAYLEEALTFEQLAAREPDPELKADLMKQAKADRKLAADRALKDPLTPLVHTQPSDRRFYAMRPSDRRFYAGLAGYIGLSACCYVLLAMWFR